MTEVRFRLVLFCIFWTCFIIPQWCKVMTQIILALTFMSTRLIHVHGGGWGSTPLLDGLTPFLKVDPPGWLIPLRVFPKIFGNKNAIISKNYPRKIDPPFRNFGLCSKDPPPWKKSHPHVCLGYYFSTHMYIGHPDTIQN